MRNDGRLTAMDIDVLLDGGAYVTLSPVVLSRGVIHATGPYRCPDVRIRGRVTMTNTPPNGAFRGFGAPQTQFAAEVHMERIAEALGMDPVRLREVNAFRPGRHDGDRPEAREGLQRPARSCARQSGGRTSGGGAARSPGRTAGSASRSSSTARVSRAEERSSSRRRRRSS